MKDFRIQLFLMMIIVIGGYLFNSKINGISRDLKQLGQHKDVRTKRIDQSALQAIHADIEKMDELALITKNNRSNIERTQSQLANYHKTVNSLEKSSAALNQRLLEMHEHLKSSASEIANSLASTKGFNNNQKWAKDSFQIAQDIYSNNPHGSLVYLLNSLTHDPGYIPALKQIQEYLYKEFATRDQVKNHDDFERVRNLYADSLLNAQLHSPPAKLPEINQLFDEFHDYQVSFQESSDSAQERELKEFIATLDSVLPAQNITSITINDLKNLYKKMTGVKASELSKFSIYYDVLQRVVGADIPKPVQAEAKRQLKELEQFLTKQQLKPITTEHETLSREFSRIERLVKNQAYNLDSSISDLLHRLGDFSGEVQKVSHAYEELIPQELKKVIDWLNQALVDTHELRLKKYNKWACGKLRLAIQQFNKNKGIFDDDEDGIRRVLRDQLIPIDDRYLDTPIRQIYEEIKSKLLHEFGFDKKVTLLAELSQGSKTEIERF
jgi:hypothetical protein